MLDRYESAATFDRNVLIDALNEGEQLVEPPLHTTDDLRDQYGYEIYPIRDVTGEGNSVFLVMELQGDAVEPVELVGPVKLTIRPVVGEGLVIIYTPGSGLSAHLLAADGGPNSKQVVELVPGDSYAYLNIGEGPFVVRDDSTRIDSGEPHFRPEYEVPATTAALLAELAMLGIGRS
jgi:hypothetical protein